MAWGKKLLLSLSFCHQRKCLPDGSRVKRQLPGCNWTMFQLSNISGTEPYRAFKMKIPKGKFVKTQYLKGH